MQMARVERTVHRVRPDDGDDESQWMVGYRRRWYVQALSKGLQIDQQIDGWCWKEVTSRDLMVKPRNQDSHSTPSHGRNSCRRMNRDSPYSC